jgi:carbonic anhydrase/acetyltransferase-like protein (isoleucine patch superfamily)
MESTKMAKLENEIKLFPYLGIFPKIHPSVFLASGVKIIGDVEIGENSSVWYNSVVRGDVHYIKIGEMTNIQDCSVLHVTSEVHPLNIGNNVTVGHNVVLHGCTLKGLSLIGMGAVILDGAVVEENTLVAAGSVIKEKFIVPAGKLVAGVPAKIIRNLTGEEIKNLEESAKRYVKYSELMTQSLKNLSS